MSEAEKIIYSMRNVSKHYNRKKIIEDISFPFEVTEEIVDKIVQKVDGKNTSHMAMYL